MVIPTLYAGQTLAACLEALERQTLGSFDVVVVDNSGRGLARACGMRHSQVTVIENAVNAGFGEAVNQGVRLSRAPFLATLNDDAVAGPGWLEALVRAAESGDRIGMCASRVMLAGRGRVDSAGMLACSDGSSRQRGHDQLPDGFLAREETLFPSGAAALYRRAMLEEIGLLDAAFFLYCEDTDLGLRGRWAGWKCLYAPDAVVEHRYSHSAGPVSPLKAYLVERNRLFVLLKNYPLAMLVRAPFAALARYFWHLASVVRGRGAAGRFRAETGPGAAFKLALYTARAHLALLARLPRLLRQRREIRRRARISAAEFRSLIDRHFISPREVASL